MKASKYVTNFLWRVIETCTSQAVTFIVSVILARLVSPDDYGTLAVVSVFISLCSIFVDSGFGMALVQKKDADDLDFSSIFYFNIVMCMLLYGIIFMASPLIARFYAIDELALLIRVQGLNLLISGVRAIQTAYVSKHLLFKQAFFATIGSTLASAVVGITLAYLGFGIWALVAQSVFSNLVGTVILWGVIKWRPQRVFSLDRVKALFSYGSKLLLSSLVNIGYSDLRQLLIGKVYTTADLAYFNRGASVPGLCHTVISSGTNSVLLPTMSNVQESPSNVKFLVRKSIRIQTYVLLPAFVGLALCSEPLIRLLFTDVWAEAIPFQQMFCCIYMLECVASTNANALKAMGRSGTMLTIECIKTPVYTLILLISMPFGTKAIAIGYLLSCAFGTILCVAPGKKVFGYSIFEQLRDVLPHIALSAVMGLCVWFVSMIPMNNLLTLIVRVCTGVVVYVALSIAFKLECFTYVKDQLLALIRR